MKKERVFPRDFVKEAIETADHILWELIIRIYGNANSVTFQQKGNEVRVVYGIMINNHPKIKNPKLPPNEYFPLVKNIFTKLSMSCEPINKIAVSNISEMEMICSHPDYFKFFKDTLVDRSTSFKGEVVEIYLNDGTRLYCPCNGTHLNKPNSLYSWFNVNFHRLKRVGQDKYEFRFNVTAVS